MFARHACIQQQCGMIYTFASHGLPNVHRAGLFYFHNSESSKSQLRWAPIGMGKGHLPPEREHFSPTEGSCLLGLLYRCANASGGKFFYTPLATAVNIIWSSIWVYPTQMYRRSRRVMIVLLLTTENIKAAVSSSFLSLAVLLTMCRKN